MSLYPALQGLDMAWSSHIILDRKFPTHEILTALNDAIAHEEDPMACGRYACLSQYEATRSLDQTEMKFGWGRVLMRIHKQGDPDDGIVEVRGIVAACHELNGEARVQHFSRVLNEMGRSAKRLGASHFILPFGGQKFGEVTAMGFFGGAYGTLINSGQSAGLLRFETGEGNAVRFVPKKIIGPSIVSAQPDRNSSQVVRAPVPSRTELAA